MFLLGVYADMGKILTEHANTCIIVRNSVCPQIFCTQGKLSEDSRLHNRTNVRPLSN